MTPSFLLGCLKRRGGPFLFSKKRPIQKSESLSAFSNTHCSSRGVTQSHSEPRQSRQEEKNLDKTQESTRRKEMSGMLSLKSTQTEKGSSSRGRHPMTSSTQDDSTMARKPGTSIYEKMTREQMVRAGNIQLKKLNSDSQRKSLRLGRPVHSIVLSRRKFQRYLMRKLEQSARSEAEKSSTETERSSRQKTTEQEAEANKELNDYQCLQEKAVVPAVMPQNPRNSIHWTSSIGDSNRLDFNVMRIMNEEEEERQAVAAIENSLSFTFDTPGELFGTLSSTGDPTQSPEQTVWDSNVMYGTDENAFINLNDDDMLNASFVDDCLVDIPNKINVETPSYSETPSPPTTSSEEDTSSALEFDVTVKAGRKTYYVVKERSLFTQLNVGVPFIVHCPAAPPPESFIRICAVYSMNIFANDPVHRCPYHRSIDQDREEHFILVDNPEAQYLTEKDDYEEIPRPYVIVPFNALPNNRQLTLRFRCYSSCAGGIKRRAVVLCFSLENGKRLLGHSEMNLKVCAVPSRVANMDSADGKVGRPPDNCQAAAELVSIAAKNIPRPHIWEDDDTVCTLEIRGRRLCKIIQSVVRCIQAENMPFAVADVPDSVSWNTPIESWLNDLQLSKYEHIFAAKKQHIIADLVGIIDNKYLLSLGVTDADATKMLSSFLDWFSGCILMFLTEYHMSCQGNDVNRDA